LAKCIDYPDTITNFGSDRIYLQAFGISSNIMSLTGIALAIGVVVDDGIVMVEMPIEVFLKDKKKWILINNRTMKNLFKRYSKGTRSIVV
jgi:Cu/Ag efflux pump CusA